MSHDRLIPESSRHIKEENAFFFKVVTIKVNVNVFSNLYQIRTDAIFKNIAYNEIILSLNFKNCILI